MLTANQMILLLQIYRGTEKDEFKIGTYAEDMKHLTWCGYIMPIGHGTFNVTPLAHAWIRDRVLQEPA